MSEEESIHVKTPGKQNRPCAHSPCLSLLQEALGAGPQKAKEEEK